MPMYPIPNVPDCLAREIYASLLRYLPPPRDDTAEARITRDSRAMAAVAALMPENAEEAELAVSAVATDFHAKDALAGASQPRLTTDALMNLRSMTASMLRQSQNLIRTLRQLQADRRKLEEALYPAAMERSGHWFKDASLMAPGLPPGMIPPPTEPTGEPPRRVFSQADAAEQFAARHPAQAAAIRAHNGPPPDCEFTPPAAELIAAILTSTSPILLELDAPQAAGPASPTAKGTGIMRGSASPIRGGVGVPPPLAGGEGDAANSPTNPATSNAVSRINPLRRP